MDILVLNGSPKKLDSDTLCVTRAFLAGYGGTAEILHTVDLNVRPCCGCYACWYKTPGQCIYADDMEQVLRRIVEAEQVIWSTPMYFYGFPASLKLIIDRLLPLYSKEQTVNADGLTCHPLTDTVSKKMILIAGCGFPDNEGNFDGLRFQFRRMFGNRPMICAAEAPLFHMPTALIATKPYLQAAEKAGKELRELHEISAETAAVLRSPMVPGSMYRMLCNNV